ncbi:prepilin-type N-terminal cleavage/methylation domain-containing protein [candidate division GN15 bacterium]|nr:prepilin-type N-terminal cleavage/methylation domain-containing protein [candidate division GN15 bacterium]
MFNRNLSDQRGFTLIELVIIIVVLGILAAVAIPKYQDIAGEARESSCKASLGGLRSGIAIWYAKEAVKNSTAQWPPYDSLVASGVVFEQTLPNNPYQPNAGDSVVSGYNQSKGTVVGTRGGWVYNDSTGQVWPNTNTVGENTW